ncbi:4665_t:CDS:2 [Paraglomus brasilianum]|uniref:4665_t:CDS:1 n=1 Tax=Paraglomus brasilianum TaxID=144538 RepID=A0A9N9AQG9_9GLOM|nr:4665_t:CDS:2 [Paraglomus brasilianum]
MDVTLKVALLVQDYLMTYVGDAGTAVSVKEHMQTCIFEKLKVYIDSNNTKLEKLEKIVMDQQQEISKLRRLIKASKFNMLPSADDVAAIQDGITDDPAIGDEDEDVYLGLSSFPHGDIACQRTISQHKCGVTSLAFSRGLIYAGAHDGSTKIFNADTGQMIKDLNGHQVSVWALAVCHETERFFSAGSDGVIKVWDWNFNQPNACVKTLTQHSGKIYGMVVSGNKLFSASSDKTVKVWDPITLENLATFTGHTDGVNNLIAIGDDKLATAGSDSTVKIWDVTTGTCIHTISCNSSEVLDVAFGDNMLFASTNDAVIHVYNINDNHSTAISTLAGHNWEVWQLEYTIGALFSASFDHTIKRWDVRNRMICNATLKGHQGKLDR